VKKVLLVAVLAAAVLVPAASAKSAARVKISLIPLPKSALGSSAHGLVLAHDSGVISNTGAANRTADASAVTFKKLGRVSGYALDYGDAYSGAAGITDVRTTIEQYKTPADAKRGLAFWRKEDARLGALDNPGFTVTHAFVKVPAVRKTRFAYLASFSASNIAPVSSLDERFADGRDVLEVTVSAGTAAAAEALAPKLAKKLDARLRLALNGRLHAKPVKLPPKPKAGPPTGGPDLSAIALRTSDLSGGATVIFQGYGVHPAILDFVDLANSSEYDVLMVPAGPFDILIQEVEWYPTANGASFNSDFLNAFALSQAGTTALDLSSVGDAAQGSITQGSGAVVFSSGQLSEFIDMGVAQGAIDSNDVTNVAQTAASKIDAVLGG
jgi:opacity protein-like surface antigen